MNGHALDFIWAEFASKNFIKQTIVRTWWYQKRARFNRHTASLRVVFGDVCSCTCSKSEVECNPQPRKAIVRHLSSDQSDTPFLLHLTCISILPQFGRVHQRRCWERLQDRQQQWCLDWKKAILAMGECMKRSHSQRQSDSHSDAIQF